MRRRLATFHWETRSRLSEEGGRITGSVFVVSRLSPDGVLAIIHAVGMVDAYAGLVEWGVLFARAAGANIVQITTNKGLDGTLAPLGFSRVRPWWRMDRSLAGALPKPAPVAGYELIDGSAVPAGGWTDLFNRTFADHWRFVPRSEAEIAAGKPPELCLMAVTSRERAPAAITLGELEAYQGDTRPQPVGLVSSVGTLPEHRRRGLARWLVAETLQRLRAASARSSSLYVDGMSSVRAYDVYRKLGFDVAFEAEVWEATFP